MMTAKKNIKIQENTAVGVFRNGREYLARIIYPDIKTGKDTTIDRQLVCTLRFSGLLEALGYCTVLNTLSSDSVEKVIAMNKD